MPGSKAGVIHTEEYAGADMHLPLPWQVNCKTYIITLAQQNPIGFSCWIHFVLEISVDQVCIHLGLGQKGKKR